MIVLDYVSVGAQTDKIKCFFTDFMNITEHESIIGDNILRFDERIKNSGFGCIAIILSAIL